MPSYLLKIHGKVQGVFYRDFVQDNAAKLRINGWVKNEPDRSVSAFIQGDEKSLSELIEILTAGPSHANVIKIDKTKLAEDESLKGFKIHY